MTSLRDADNDSGGRWVLAPTKSFGCSGLTNISSLLVRISVWWECKLLLLPPVKLRSVLQRTLRAKEEFFGQHSSNSGSCLCSANHPKTTDYWVQLVCTSTGYDVFHIISVGSALWYGHSFAKTSSKTRETMKAEQNKEPINVLVSHCLAPAGWTRLLP